MNHIAIGEDADDLTDGVGLTNICQELISQARTFRCAFNNAGDIDEGERCRKEFFGGEDCGQLCKPLIRNADNSYVGFDGGEGVVGSQDIVLGESVKKGRLSYIGQADDSN